MGQSWSKCSKEDLTSYYNRAGGGSSCNNSPDPNNWCQQQWQGYCTWDTSAKQYFQTNCKKLCGLCQGGGGGSTCDNRPDPNGWCQSQFSWICNSNTQWTAYFHQNCKKMCGKC